MDLQRGYIRSKSLENLTNLGTVKDDKSIYGQSLSPHNTIFHGLKKRFIEGLKLSKSNQDVTSSASVEENRKYLSPQSSLGSLGMEKKQRDEKSKSSLKLDGRKRSRTTTDHCGSSHSQTPPHEPLSVTTSVGESGIDRARSFTGEFNDQFVLVDTLSIDESNHRSSNSLNEVDDAWDEADGRAPDNERTSHEIDKLKLKINRTRQQLLEMQNTKAENVQEFLESANQRNKANFEKRQQKTNANIQQMQRKLDKYQKNLKDLEERGVSQHRAKEMFRGVHVAVKAGASSLSEAVAKPIESMNKLIKKERRVGSADNLGSTIGTGDGSSTHIDETEQAFFNYSDDDASSISSAANIPLNISGSLTAHSVNNQSYVMELERLRDQSNEISQLKKENEELRETIHKLKEQLNFLAEDERFRHEDLQSQIRDLFNQYNDLTELHQQEIMDVKEEIYKAIDRIECVDYRSAERAGEIEEALDSCVTRINKMGLQQEHQQQQFFDGYFEGSGTAKILLSKALSVVVSLFAIVLVIVSLAARVISPFVSTWKRAIISFAFIVLLFMLWRSADRPVLQQLHHKASDLFLIAYDKLNSKSKFTQDALSANQR